MDGGHELHDESAGHMRKPLGEFLRENVRSRQTGAAVAILSCCGVLFAQGPPKARDTIHRSERHAEAPAAAQKAAFDARDLSGIWRVMHGETLSKEAPSMTAWARARYSAAKPGIGPRAQPNGNDPIMACNPPGFPRILLFGAYPMEIVETPNRLIQFFDFFYTYRTIWTDGRTLPKDPDPRWYGYSSGHWDGNTLVVESSGFDDRSWLDQDGHPHSDEMRIEERYQRIDPDTITVKITLNDPKAYSEPWVSDPITLKRDTRDEMREDVCAPADEEKYKEDVRGPAGAP